LFRSALTLRREPGRARRPEKHQEWRPSARSLEARQDRGARAGDEATCAEHHRRPEGLPGRAPDPLGLCGRFGRRGPTQGSELAGQFPDAFRWRRQRLHARVQGLPREPGEDLMQVLEAAAARTANPWPLRRERAAELAKRYPHAAQMLRLYHPLHALQEGAYIEAQSSEPAEIVNYAATTVLPLIVDATASSAPA